MHNGNQDQFDEAQFAQGYQAGMSLGVQLGEESTDGYEITAVNTDPSYMAGYLAGAKGCDYDEALLIMQARTLSGGRDD